ncbi:MAG TPA: flagellar basal body-associated FliL family protein [Firmicutes bacterium]|nr:flagellar basal body-associated FliL family protein [Bacillota bacterium]
MSQNEIVVADKKRGRARIWLGVATGLLIVVLAGGYFLSGSHPGLAGRSALSTQRWEMRDVIVNLSDPGLHRYLRAEITLEYNSPNLTAELEKNAYRVRDAVIEVLRGKTTADLQNATALKGELLEAVNAQLQQGRIDALYFGELIIQ